MRLTDTPEGLALQLTDDDGEVQIADVPGGDYVLSIVDSDTA